MPFSFFHLLTLTGFPCMQVVIPLCAVPLNQIAVPDFGALPLKKRLKVSPVLASSRTWHEVSTAFSTHPEPLIVLELDVCWDWALAAAKEATRHTTAGIFFNVRYPPSQDDSGALRKSPNRDSHLWDAGHSHPPASGPRANPCPAFFCASGAPCERVRRPTAG